MKKKCTKTLKNSFINVFLVLGILLAGCTSSKKEEISYQTVSTIEKAMEIADFPLEVPEEIASSVLKEVNVYETGMIEVIYLNLNHHETCVVRKAEGNESDISNNYEEYAKVEDIEIDGIHYTMKGIRSNVYLVLWKNEGYSYSLYLAKGKYQPEVIELLKEIK